MAAWVNLMDIVYPVGSLYFSRLSTSPASTIGGSWTRIQGAVIAAYGTNGFTGNNYGGSLKISVNQMPAHAHNVPDGAGLIRQINWGHGLWFADGGSGNIGMDGNGAVFLSEGGREFLALPLWSIRLVQNRIIISPLLEVI